ncbi:MAG: radical SAM protein [Deltaproteobacteria bacterium]|nr:radical SAM protein [Deltaproteobacteria bacterium]MDQ3295871.1 radical SAM protein [Myxococcota bacterium]
MAPLASVLAFAYTYLVRYVGKLYRPPSEADALILQATIGCSWNHCTYCDMYRDKPDFRVRPLAESLEDLAHAAGTVGDQVEKVFVADGDALVMDVAHWEPILEACRRLFPRLRRVSCYAMAKNVLAKSDAELRRLRDLGLTLLYMGPESGDDVTLKRIAKGSTAADHVEAARRARAAGLELSAIFLLGAGGSERSAEHAAASADLASAMDPQYLAALTLTVVPTTPLATLAKRGKFELPRVDQLLGELRTFVDRARPTDALFRTNHASNYLPLGGRLPRDRARIVAVIDEALAGGIALRPERARGL